MSERNSGNHGDLITDTNALLESVRRSIDEIKALDRNQSEDRIVIEPKSENSAQTERLNPPLADSGKNRKRPSWFKRVKNAAPPWALPLTLYLLTWLTTTGVGSLWYGGGSVFSGLLFSAPLMTILTCHELGHYFQNRRYGISATLPYFIPVPIPPLGTFGAIILMRGRAPNSRALFDVGISGPLAGLAVTLVFLTVGLTLSTVVPTTPELLAQGGFVFSEPLIMQWFAKALIGYDPATETLIMHPTAVAAWVGVLLTTLNLFPIGQLDDGHVFNALARHRAKTLSYMLFGLAAVAVVIFRCWNWSLLLILLFFLGLRHPNTQNDFQPLGLWRTVLGWATLAFIILGFTANPLDYREPAAPSPAETAVESVENPA